jgi:phenylpyruvate tautomerase PptA (4-oxalocrotonate tautomerase family)
MPLVRITLAQGRPAEERRAIADAVHRALVEAANAPADDQFQVVEEVPAENLVFSPSYLGIPHTGPMVFVQVFMNVGRTVEVKKALYARLADAVVTASASRVRKEDVIVGLVEVQRENWSFGGGLMSYPPAP